MQSNRKEGSASRPKPMYQAVKDSKMPDLALLGDDFSKSIKPDIDVIEGVEFMSWENEKDMNNFNYSLLLNEKAKESSFEKFGNKVIHLTKTRDITKIKGWKNKKFATDLLANVKKEPKENMDTSSDSTFVSKFLDKYIDEIKNGSRSFPLQNSLSKVNSWSSLHKLKRNEKCLKSSNDIEDEEEFTYNLLNDNFNRKSKGRLKKDGTFYKKVNYPIICDISVCCLNSSHLEALFCEYMIKRERMKKCSSNCNFKNMMLSEKQVKYALSALHKSLTTSRVVKSKSALKTTNQSKRRLSTNSDKSSSSVSSSSCLKDQPKVVKSNEDVADLASLISRHSKREIRLPARYHDSGLILGNSWISPEYDSPQRKRKVRRVSQDSFYNTSSLSSSRSKVNSSKLPTTNNIRNPSTSLSSSSSSSTFNLKNSKGKSTILDSGSDKKMLTPPIRLMSSKSYLKDEQTNLKLNSSTSCNKNNLIKNNNNNNFTRAQQREEASCLTQVSGQISSREISDSQNLDETSKNLKLMQLRELYRRLYFENKPERRAECAQKGIKPRVNKREVVEEGIEVIEKLKKRDKQLEYLKKLLNMWNKKLNLAHKVIHEKG